MSSKLPSIEQVAVAFLAHLRWEIGEEKYAQVVAQQVAEPIAGVCYSHDHCDANMVMHAAFNSLGVDPLPDLEADMSQEVCDLWNAAWDRALELMVAR